MAAQGPCRDGRPAHLTGWGLGPPVETCVLRPSRPSDVGRWIGRGPLIARGAGRGYGDCAAARGLTIDMTRCDRILEVDPQAPLVVAEAGARLRDLIAVTLPRGAFPPVVPGTGAVTLGGMIAADVHGKNHHRAGSLRGHLAWVDLMGPDGGVTRLLPGTPLFDRTVGGMGLTGVILRAALRLTPVSTGWLRQETRAAGDLAGLLAALAEAEVHDHAVAWMDASAGGAATGRGLVLAASHLGREDLPAPCRADPLALRAAAAPRRPGWLPPLPQAAWRLQGALNALRFRRGLAAAGRPGILPWHRFFFPLDALPGWNRLYGAAGLVQLQVCFPEAGAEAAIRGLLRLFRSRGLWPTLAVVKRLAPAGGAAGIGFAGGGVSLAIDLPRTGALVAAAEEVTAQCLAAGGRFYLAKDSLLTAPALRASDPRAAAFADWRRAGGHAGAFASALSERLEL